MRWVCPLISPSSSPLITTVSSSDLGTEGAGDADIALRKCLSGPDPLIPGPRYFCATRAIAPTGSYGSSPHLSWHHPVLIEKYKGPKSSLFVNKEGIDGVTGVEVADGVDECIKAVRRQIGAGADWIKVIFTFAVIMRRDAHICLWGATIHRSMQVNELSLV